MIWCHVKLVWSRHGSFRSTASHKYEMMARPNFLDILPKRTKRVYDYDKYRKTLKLTRRIHWTPPSLTSEGGKRTRDHPH